MGPIAFVIVFMIVPLAAAFFAGAFFAAIGIMHVLAAVPTGAWAALTVAAGLVVAARLCVVIAELKGARPGVGQGPHALEEPGPGGQGVSP